jgi:hypothetical protein
MPQKDKADKAKELAANCLGLVSERLMQPLPIVEHLDELKDLGAGLVSCVIEPPAEERPATARKGQPMGK